MVAQLPGAGSEGRERQEGSGGTLPEPSQFAPRFHREGTRQFRPQAISLARDQNGAYGVGEANEVDQLRVHGGVSGPLVRLGLLPRVDSGAIGAASQLHAEAKAADAT